MAGIRNPEKAKNPTMSVKQKRFENWARKHKLDLSRNWFVPYHAESYTYEELFADITPDSYYMEDKTQGAWDAWRLK